MKFSIIIRIYGPPCIYAEVLVHVFVNSFHLNYIHTEQVWKKNVQWPLTRFLSHFYVKLTAFDLSSLNVLQLVIDWMKTNSTVPLPKMVFKCLGQLKLTTFESSFLKNKSDSVYESKSDLSEERIATVYLKHKYMTVQSIWSDPSWQHYMHSQQKLLLFAN